MKKAMLSQPMAGKSEQEIRETREKAIKALEGAGFEIVNTLFTDEWYSSEKMQERGVVQIPLCFMAKSLENMANCHAAYFCEGWENARGCRIEHEAAEAYGLEILYEVPPKGYRRSAHIIQNEEFLNRARDIVAEAYLKDGVDVPFTKELIFVSSYTKTLQHHKALLGSRIPGDHRYFEITYNGDTGEFYVDDYDKRQNYVVKL